MEELLKTFMEQMNTQFSQLSNKVDHLATDITELKEGVSRLEVRMDRLENRMDGLETKVDGLEARMDKLENRQLNLEKNQQGFTLSLERYATEFRSHFKKVEDELVQHRDAFKIYSTDLNSVKAGVEFLSGKTGVHDTKINYLEKRLEV